MKATVIIFLSVICAGTYAQKEKSYTSHWRDYEHEDLMSQPADFRYSEKGKFYYYVSNDEENIYINLKIFDQNVQNQVLRSGLTVWIDMNGKKAKKLGVVYPVRSAERRPQQGMKDIPGSSETPRENRIPEEKKANQAGQSGSIKLIGFSKSEPVIISSTQKDNFRGSLKVGDDRKLFYELVLPVARLPVVNDKHGSGIKPFVLGFSYEPERSFARGGNPGGDQSMSSGRSGGGASGGGSRGGGGRGGRSSGGGSGGGMMMPQSADESIITWIMNINLASK